MGRIALDSLMVFKSKSGVFWGFYRTPENQRDEQVIQKSLDRCNEHFGLLNKVLTGQKYLGGREFSLADIPAGTNLYRYFTLDIKRPKLPNVERWYARLQERPSYRENVMIPNTKKFGKSPYLSSLCFNFPWIQITLFYGFALSVVENGLKTANAFIAGLSLLGLILFIKYIHHNHAIIL